MDRLIRMIMGRLMRRGVNGTIDAVVRQGKSHKEMSDAEKQTATGAKDAVRRSRQMMNVARRFTR